MGTIAPATMTSDGKKRPTQPVLCATGISLDRQMPYNSCEAGELIANDAPGDLCAKARKKKHPKNRAPYLNIVQRLAVVAALASLFLGCASNARESASDARIWAARLARQQEGARENGRIGWVGYDGPDSQ
jgi:hypothetical protein